MLSWGALSKAMWVRQRGGRAVPNRRKLHPGEIVLSQPRIKNDGLCFDITDEIVVDVNVAFLVVIHGIAFTDLNFLDQPHQRGTV